MKRNIKLNIGYKNSLKDGNAYKALKTLKSFLLCRKNYSLIFWGSVKQKSFESVVVWQKSAMKYVMY